MASEYAVELRDVVKKFITPEGHDLAAVDHVTMQIKNGEFFSMLGSSGCGKTTSLRMIAGFEWPTEGEVCIDGEPQAHKPPFLRPVNTVFQSYALFQHMTVAQNVAFGLEMERVEKSQIERRVGEVLDMVKLSGMERRKPKQLSGGQQQRVFLARALAQGADIFLLDEPFTGLDMRATEDLAHRLLAWRDQGRTVLAVEHETTAYRGSSSSVVARRRAVHRPRTYWREPGVGYCSA